MAQVIYGNDIPTTTTIGKGGTVLQVPSYKPATTKKDQDPVTPKTVNVNSGGGGGYSYSGGSSDDVLDMIKSLLQQQQEQSQKFYEEQYNQQLAQNKQAWENNRNKINVNYKRADNYIRNSYDPQSNYGISNRVRNNSNWISYQNQNDQNLANNNSNASLAKSQGLANSANTLAQGWYNYVMPIYTNRQANMDDYDYRKFLATL